MLVDAADAALEDLMVQYVDGRETAFNALYQRLSPRILGYLLRLTRNRDQAEDLMQVTFTKIHRARSSYLRDGSLPEPGPGDQGVPSDVSEALDRARGYKLLRKQLDDYSRN